MWWILGAIVYILLLVVVLLFFAGASALETPPVPQQPELRLIPEREQNRKLAAILD